VTFTTRHFTIEFAPLFIQVGRYALLWSPRDELVLCKGLDTVVCWRRIQGRWVNCTGF
jgi:hypothetical protein